MSAVSSGHSMGSVPGCCEPTQEAVAEEAKPGNSPRQGGRGAQIVLAAAALLSMASQGWLCPHALSLSKNSHTALLSPAESLLLSRTAMHGSPLACPMVSGS